MIPLTARDLLEQVGGDEHACHTVMKKTITRSVTVKLHCSCGSILTADYTETNRYALRNVPDKEVV